MNRLALLDEAQVRELELDGEDKKYLVDVLVLNDEAYVELMDQIGCRVLAIDFAQGAVRHHNQNLRRERAEAEAAQQQDIHEAHKKKKQGERAKAEKLAFEKRQAEKRAKELKQAADAKEHEQKRKRKESQNPDSGYSSKSSASPETGESSDTASSKGKKRARPNYDNAEDSTPNKKVKSSQTSKAPRVIKPKRKPAALPRAMQAGATKASSANSKDIEMSDKPVKSASKKTTKVDSPSTRPSQTGRPRTRSNWVVEDAEDEDMEDADQDTDNESEFADYIEDDMGGRKRKSNIGAMASSKLFAGL
jgi:chemotaxis protein histidine kinase CheA